MTFSPPTSFGPRPFRRGRFLVLATASVALMGFALLGCYGSTSPTTPSDGGGQGGGSQGGGERFDSGPLNAPATFVHTFPTAGAVGYHCNFHAMNGTVTVVDGAADSVVVAVNAMSFVPQTVSIRPGGHVRWNVVQDRHTVTSDN